jgi:hypothetical protein
MSQPKELAKPTASSAKYCSIYGPLLFFYLNYYFGKETG